MRKDKKARLEKAGWRVGDAQDFLGLADAEYAVVRIRVALATTLRRKRLARHMSQAALAKRLGSSQSRIAKMEAGDPTVSLDLLMRSLVVSGSTAADIGKAISAA
jgi:ribosome-binding protein aMBF1 (putative translation factor)